MVVAKTTELIINQLIKENFIDDLRFAKAYVNDKIKLNKWGKQKIAASLQNRVNHEALQEAFDDFDRNTYQDIVFQELKKKDKTLKNLDFYQRKRKLSEFGYSRGYEFEWVNRYFQNENSEGISSSGGY